MLQKKEILIVEAENSLHILASFFAFIFAIGLYFISFFKFPVDTTILDTHVRAINMESTRVQSILFMILMGFLVIICTCMLLCTKVKIFFNTDKVSVASAILLVIASIVFGSWSKQFLQGFLFVAVFLIFLRTRWFALISNVYSQSIFSCSLPYEKVFSWILACIVVVYITIFLVAPLATPLLISGATELRGIEGHYAVTVLPGFDLIGGVERANYGLGMPLLTALALKVFALFKISNVSLVQAVKLNQLIAVVLICFLSFLTNRKYFPYVMAMALGMTAFTLSNVGIAVGYPNQSGIRYIPILTSLIVLVMELHRAQLRVWVLASTAAIFVILSPETGLATTAGYITATILKKYIPITPISSIARTLLWFGVAMNTKKMV